MPCLAHPTFFVFLSSFAILMCKAASADSADPIADSMVGLWSTPILKRTLLSNDMDGAQLNGEIATTIMKGLSDFQREVNWTGSFSSTDKQGLNDLFYDYQKKHWENTGKLWAPLQQSNVVAGLLDAIQKLATNYLDAVDPARTKKDLDIYMWAGVHFGCIAHLAHIHPGSAVSGTYYVNVPSGSGALVIGDPRGMLPPFGNRYIHHPVAGEVIMFPSWIRHEVAPSCEVSERNPRIALSFNVVGDWSTTTDATSLFFDLAPNRNREL